MLFSTSYILLATSGVVVSTAFAELLTPRHEATLFRNYARAMPFDQMALHRRGGGPPPKKQRGGSPSRPTQNTGSTSAQGTAHGGQEGQYRPWQPGGPRPQRNSRSASQLLNDFRLQREHIEQQRPPGPQLPPDLDQNLAGPPPLSPPGSPRSSGSPVAPSSPSAQQPRNHPSFSDSDSMASGTKSKKD